MEVSVDLLTQLRDAAGMGSLTVHLEPGSSVKDLVKALCSEYGPRFTRHALNEDGEILPGLLLAVDGVQVSDPDAPLSGVQKVLLGTAIAGG